MWINFGVHQQSHFIWKSVSTFAHIWIKRKSSMASDPIRCRAVVSWNVFLIKDLSGNFWKIIKSLNTNYMLIFNNPRDRQQIRTLSRQMYPNNSRFISECYDDATESKHFGYLFLDLTEKTIQNYRIKLHATKWLVSNVRGRWLSSFIDKINKRY